MLQLQEAVISQDIDVIDNELEQYCIVEATKSENHFSDLLSSSSSSSSSEEEEEQETIRERINRVREDLTELISFYNITVSPSRTSRLQSYHQIELDNLKQQNFTLYNQQEKIDFLLLRNFLEKGIRQLEIDDEKNKTMEESPLLLFAGKVIELCEDRQNVKPMDAQKAAEIVYEVGKQISKIKERVVAGKIKVDGTTAFRAANTADELQAHLKEWFGFYNGYDPMFMWWVTEPYGRVDKELTEYTTAIREHLLNIKPGNGDKPIIVGDPVGRIGLLADLHAEMIPYTPEELLQIGELEYKWCETQMILASQDLGYGSDWHAALSHVKSLFVPPGQQTQLVKDLSDEAISYVRNHNLITVPPLASETIRMTMMTPAQQLVNPFFLGGSEIIVSYPTDNMSHSSKIMSMRGNNVHFSRSTVFHELIPGHRLQLFMNGRHNPHRTLFQTCFSVEGWAFYWEMLLWDDAEFPKSPEDRIGMLFWRMHRCLRIIFSVNFHLGKVTPRECVDLLVERAGHERDTAEGEVRRSLSGEYPPLYQAGYMIGALQLYALRKEVVEGGIVGEKRFHDRVMREGQMPIELLRALIRNDPLTPDHKASWRFYNL